MLGSGTWECVFVDRNGTDVAKATQQEIGNLVWNRLQNATSTAKLVLQPPRGMADTLEPWAHRLRIFRDEEEQWSGPVYSTSATVGQLTITCRDHSAWLAKRRIRTRDYGTTQPDVAAVAYFAIRDAYLEDDPADLRNNVFSEDTQIAAESGVLREDGRYVLALLADQVKLGMVWTVLGRATYLGSPTSVYTLDTLDDASFLGELEVVRDGSATVTNAVVYGKGVSAEDERPAAPGGAQHAIPTLELSVKADTITDVGSAGDLAYRSWVAGYPTPRRVIVPSGSALSQLAPVSLSELVPGVLVPVETTATGSVVSTTQRLTKVDVTVTAAGEKISITLDADEDLAA